MRNLSNFSAPIYDPNKTWEENAEEGPFFKGPIPERMWPDETKDFLGFQIASPLGVAAGPLLNSRWIDLAAQLGFDVLTYKTIRCRPHASHPLPNITFVDVAEQLDIHHLPEKVVTTTSPKELAITNSFGNPSKDRDFLIEDIRRAKGVLHPGQVLIVSVFGTETSHFVETAQIALEGEAPIVEANYSCPNVSAGEGSLYLNPEAVYAISTELCKTIGDVPLVIKVGTFPGKEALRATLVAAARAGVRGVAGINTISLKVETPQGEPALGSERLTSGICGYPIRRAALQFVRDARAIIEEEKLDLTLIGGGGVTRAEQFDAFLEAGSDIVTTATGMMWDPYLAAQYHQHQHHQI